MCTHSLLAHFNPPTQSAARETDVATILSPSIRQRTYLGLARRELLESPCRPLPSPPQRNLNRIESHESRAVSSDHCHQSGGESASWQTMLSWFHITNHNAAMITTQVWSYCSVLYNLLVPHFVDLVITRGTTMKTRSRHSVELLLWLEVECTFVRKIIQIMEIQQTKFTLWYLFESFLNHLLFSFVEKQ